MLVEGGRRYARREGYAAELNAAPECISAKVDPARLKAFDERWGPTFGILAKTDAAICLPSADKLDKLSIAQAELAKSFGK